jgi:hypothetical protein
MGNRQDTDFVVEVLAEVISRRATKDGRLANGARLRQEIQDSIKAGVVVDHYRYTWLRESANQVIDIMKIIAGDFDRAHPDDMCSGADLLDILRVAYTKMAAAYQAIADEEKTGT